MGGEGARASKWKDLVPVLELLQVLRENIWKKGDQVGNQVKGMEPWLSHELGLYFLICRVG